METHDNRVSFNKNHDDVTPETKSQTKTVYFAAIPEIRLKMYGDTISERNMMPNVKWHSCVSVCACVALAIK